MNLNKRKLFAAVGVALSILLIDQWVKILIKTRMMINEFVKVTDWFYIYFTENPGMAFGMEIIDKLYLTLFRIVAGILLGVYLGYCVKKNLKTGYILAIAAIFAGAWGNVIDCIFYGEYFSSSVGQVASFLPEGGGYASLMHGKVVDMLYFPLIDTVLPEWVPFWGGKSFQFFRPIFNIADSAITCGMFAILLFYREYITGNESSTKG